MKRSVKLRVLSLIAVVVLSVGCHKEEVEKPKEVDGFHMEYIYDDGVEKADVRVKKIPTHIVSLSHFMTEILLSLGLQDRMAGTALLNEEILPEYREAYKEIPELKMGEGHMVSKEAFLSTGVDFVAGWEQSISEEGTGSVEELMGNGISPFIMKSLQTDATIETVYEDIELLGQIFDVKERADKVTGGMKAKVMRVQRKVEKISEFEKVDVLIYDSGEGEAFVAGGGLPSDLIRLAGGNNIFSNLENDYAVVSFESIVDKNPDIIVVTDYYSGIPAERKVDFLKNHPGLKEVRAVQGGRIYIIGLADIAPGVRNAGAVNKLFNFFYGEKNEKKS